MSVRISYAAERAVQEEAEHQRSNVLGARARAKREVAVMKARTKAILNLLAVLPAEAEFQRESYWNYRYPTVTVPREALVKLRAAVGRLHVKGRDLKSVEDRLVTISLTAEKYPGIEFKYDRPLVEGASCKIVEQTSKYRTLVCSRE